MNKKKFVVLALLMIAVITLSSCMLVACNNDTEDDTSSTTATVTETEGLLIKNGDFKVIDTASTTYPRSITSWTGAKMYSSGDYKSDVTAGAISLDKALYDANKSKWDDDNDELYNKLVANNRYDNDDVKNALMVYMPVEGKDDDGKTINGPTAYGYTSTSFTLDKGSYYELSVDVLTHNIAGSDEDARGARIYVSSNTYAEFDGIDTKGEWKTYRILIESSPTASTSLSVMLGLGKCTASSDAGLTTGYAVFDNLSLEKIEDTDDATAESVYKKAVADELDKNAYVATATLKVPNGRFDFGTTTISSSGTPNSWSLTAGNSGKDDPAPTAPRHNGIVDLNQLVKDIADNNLSSYYPVYKIKSDADAGLVSWASNDFDNISNLFSEERADSIVGSNVFMLSQQLLTAQGIKSSRAITIERNKTYALSVDLYTVGIHGAGVTLKLTSSDGKDIVIKGIDSHKTSDYLIGDTKITVGDTTGYTNGTETGASSGEWTTYTFYIKGNQFRNYSYNMEIWLGTDGTNANTSATYHSYTSNTDSAVIYRADGTFSNGWVFIDELNLTEETDLPALGTNNVLADENNTLDCSETGLGDKTGIIVDLTSDNMFENIYADTTNKSSMDGVVKSTVAGVPTGWTSNYDTTNSSNPIITDLITDGVVSLVDEDAYRVSGGIGTYPDMPYTIDNKLAYMINSSADSYYEVETTPITIKANNYYRISMWVKTQDIKSTSGAYIYVLQKNGEGEDDTTLATFSKINTADYDEYQKDWCELTIIVAGSDKKDTTISFKFTLGTGTRWTASTLATGSMFIANVNGGNISHSTYSGTSTGTYVKAIDLKTTTSYAFSNGGFDSYDLDDESGLVENKGLDEQTIAATPSNWTISDSKLNQNSDESNLVAGVIKFNTTDNLNFTASAQANAAFKNTIDFDGFYPTISSSSSLDDLNALPGSKGHVLAIGNNSQDSTGYAVGFASSSITLSANTYYKLSFYARTYGATKATAYLTGESSLTTGVSSFTIESTDSIGWTKYTFYIEVGQTSVSTKLNLWLGENVDYIEISDAEYAAVKDNAEYTGWEEKDVKNDLKEKKAVSTGNVFYDNVYYTSIDEADYYKAVEGNEVHKLSFLTDSFDALSSTVDSRASLSTPNGWTGAVGSNQSSSNTKSGVVYADHNFYEVQTVDGVEYARILGKEYKLDDMTYSDKEIDEYISLHPDYADRREDAAKKVQEQKLAEKQASNWIPTSVLKAHSGNQMLVINNTEKSAYTYTSSSVTLKENSYYEVSVFVKTYGLGGADNDDTIGANIELYLGSANETDNPFSFNAIKHDDYTEYKFYVMTKDDDVTSVTVKLSLGKYVSEDVDGESVVTGLTSGYAMFDDVTITKIDENQFDAAVESEYVLKREVATETKVEGDEDEDDTTNETPDSTFNTEALWWMIPTIVLGLLIIIVVIVFVVRKVRKPIAKKKEKKAATPQETPSLDAKRDKYDDNKE